MAAVSPLQNTLTSKLRSPLSSGKKAPNDRNIGNVVLGDILFRTWYHSFYPEEIVGHNADRLYVCRWCFKYSKEIMPYMTHVKMCPAKDEPPPGRQIYEKDGYSISEVDGEEHKLFCQNLSLFAKLFLDNKSVFYDVTTFLYYLLVYKETGSSTATPRTGQVIGFFSKEKMSWDNNNLACILVFPPWQRRGLGKILMGISYELSKREGRIGGPEKPLSDLGRTGYLSFWSTTIARTILSSPAKKSLSIKQISEKTFILQDDIIAALKEMDVFDPKKRGDGSLVINKTRVREWATVNRLSLQAPVDSKAFIKDWVPQPAWEGLNGV